MEVADVVVFHERGTEGLSVSAQRRRVPAEGAASGSVISMTTLY